MELQGGMWWGCGVALALAAVSGLADYRRARRRDLEKVGFMPWPLIMVLSLMAAAVLAAFALKLG